MNTSNRPFTAKEELIHSITHGLGALAGVVGLILLILKAASGGTLAVTGAALFGSSIIILYLSSCLYHASCCYSLAVRPTKLKAVFERMDYCTIFLLILGTYAPACWSVLGGTLGWVMSGIIAACAVLGIILNAHSPEKHHKISMVIYVAAGWAIAVASVPFVKAVGFSGFFLLVLGGVLYTLGLIFYSMNTVPYMHVVWHLFVLAGTVAHYFLIYHYCY